MVEPLINYPKEKSKLSRSKLSDFVHIKYIQNLSVNTIQQAGRVVSYFLHFLNRDGSTIHTLTRQNISAYAEYEQDRGLKMQSVANHLRSLHAFIVFLVDQDVLPPEVMERKIRIKLPAPLWAWSNGYLF
jgi:site-specific recombinase XerD